MKNHGSGGFAASRAERLSLSDNYDYFLEAMPPVLVRGIASHLVIGFRKG